MLFNEPAEAINPMNASTHLKPRLKISACSPRRDRAFTFTELLVIIVMLGVLAIVVLPAVAGVQNKGGREDCANNLRQIGMASMVFASDNNGLLPVCTIGNANAGGKTNHLAGVHYTRYVFSGTLSSYVPTNAPPSQGTFQNLGYLYQAGLAGNGNIFYCPASWGNSGLGADSFSPLLTTDSSGFVRSSYLYNPRLLNAAVAAGNIRRYQTTSQLEPHKLFAVDSIENTLAGLPGINPATIPHARDHGWNVLFTDGSIQFSRLSQGNNSLYRLITTELIDSETVQSAEEYDQTYSFLEQDH